MGLFICILIFHLFNHAEIPCLTFPWCYTVLCVIDMQCFILWWLSEADGGRSHCQLAFPWCTQVTEDFPLRTSLHLCPWAKLVLSVSLHQELGLHIQINWSEMQAFDNKLIDKVTKWTTWGTDKYKSFWNMYHEISFTCLFVQIVKSVNLISSIEQI